MDVENFIEDITADNKKFLLSILIFAFIVYIDIAFITRLQLSSIAAISGKIAKVKNDINSVNNQLLRLQEKTTKAQKQQKSKVIIQEEQFSSLLQDIYTQAKNNKVNIIELKPIKEEKKTSDKAKPSAQTEKSSSVRISMQLDGNYHCIAAFINALESAEALISVEEFKIVQHPEDYLRQNAYLTLKTYVKK